MAKRTHDDWVLSGELEEESERAMSRRGYLQRLGERVKRARETSRTSRRLLAHVAGVSERYLAQLEAGRGNLSILKLREIARAACIPLEELVAEEPVFPDEIWFWRQRLHDATADELHAVDAALGAIFRTAGEGKARTRRVALIGLRGAGKSTLGRLLAEAMGVPFIELNLEIEKETGVTHRGDLRPLRPPGLSPARGRGPAPRLPALQGGGDRDRRRDRRRARDLRPAAGQHGDRLDQGRARGTHGPGPGPGRPTAPWPATPRPCATWS